MQFKIGIGLMLFALVALLLLPGMLGKMIGLALSLLVWGASGYLAGKLMRGEGYGLLVNILLGLVGGVVGSVVAAIFGISGLVQLPFIGSILVGALGSMIVVALAGLLDKQEE